MPKIITDEEMAQIIHRTVHDGDTIEDADAYEHFIEGLAELICTHFGGERGAVSGPDYPGDELGWTCGFHINACVPDDGGVFKHYDPDVTWKDGKEDQV